jgi:hypothetical protein
VSSVRYELGFYIPEDDHVHSHRRENLKSHECKLLKYSLISFNDRDTGELTAVQTVPWLSGGRCYPAASSAEHRVARGTHSVASRKPGFIVLGENGDYPAMISESLPCHNCFK